MRSSDGVEVVALGDLLPDRLARVPRHAGQGNGRQRRARRQVQSDRRPRASPASTPTRKSWRPTSTTSSSPRPRASGRRTWRRPSQRARTSSRRSPSRSTRPASGRCSRPTSSPSRRASASAPARSAGIRPSTSRRSSAFTTARSARSLSGQVFWNQGGLWNHARQQAWTRRRVADSQLAVLHLALRRPHRRAARPQHRRRQLGA